MTCMLLTTKQRQGGALLLGIQLFLFFPGFSICLFFFKDLVQVFRDQEKSTDLIIKYTFQNTIKENVF